MLLLVGIFISFIVDINISFWEYSYFLGETYYKFFIDLHPSAYLVNFFSYISYWFSFYYGLKIADLKKFGEVAVNLSNLYVLAFSSIFHLNVLWNFWSWTPV